MVLEARYTRSHLLYQLRVLPMEWNSRYHFKAYMSTNISPNNRLLQICKLLLLCTFHTSCRVHTHPMGSLETRAFPSSLHICSIDVNYTWVVFGERRLGIFYHMMCAMTDVEWHHATSRCVVSLYRRVFELFGIAAVSNVTIKTIAASIKLYNLPGLLPSRKTNHA